MLSMLASRLLRPDQAGRFAVVGLANTLFVYLVILGGLSNGLGDVAANALGNGLGLGIGFVMHHYWTFKQSGPWSVRTLAKFVASVCLAYLANLSVVIGAHQIFGISGSALVQLLAVGTYAAVSYVNCACWVFCGPNTYRTPSEVSSLIDRERMKRLWPELCVAVAWLAGLYPLINVPVSHDVTWYLWVGRQMLGGTELYRQIVETNPPLWCWMMVPVEWIAQHIGMSSVKVLNALVLLEVGLSLVLLDRLIADWPAHRRMLWLGTSFFVCTLAALPVFAHKEHATLIGTIPYLVLIARRSEGYDPSRRLALAVGCLAAPVLALKHYFAIVPLLLEAWLMRVRRKGWSPIRMEILALGAGAVLYGLAVLIFAPEFLTKIAPMLLLTYDSLNVSAVRILVGHMVPVWPLAFVLLACSWKQLPAANKAAAISAAGFALCYFVQQKGWLYQTLPVHALLVLALITVLDRPMPVYKPFRVKTLMIATALTMAVPLVAFGPYASPEAEDVNPLLRDARPGMTVMMLTRHPSRIWPMEDQRHFIWPSRYYSVWMVYALEGLDKDAPPALAALADEVRSNTWDDLVCHEPDILIADDITVGDKRHPGILSFFTKDKRFETLLKDYRKTEISGALTKYVKVGSAGLPAPADRPRDCRKIF